MTRPHELTLTALMHVLAAVRYENWQFEVSDAGEGKGFLVQVLFSASDARTHELRQEQRGRKWYVSRFATESEIVLTCFKAVLTALEHEARETFTYQGRHVLHPHPDVTELLRLADVRETRATVPA